ncbi:MAG: glycosyltransferase family 4 protein [Synergistaceae bacterium]|nr:glycosyltransferase family 4 protein [Synergistaceae bacterium]
MSERKLKIYEVLPELEIGGVERFVVDMANALADLGHNVTVVSHGGQMEEQLIDKVKKLHLSVHSKNPLKIILTAKKLARAIEENGGCDLLHAHSRVPAWICQFVAKKLRVPFVVTAHVVFGTQKRWIYTPYRKADSLVCVSQAVKEGMSQCFDGLGVVITNGLSEPKVYWSDSNLDGKTRFLFIGRLSNVKGLQDALQAFALLPKDLEWSLTVVGEGPARTEWEKIVYDNNLTDKVTFLGYKQNPDDYMASHSCLLFPSYTEGLPLTLARAIQIGIPVIASNIAPVAELADNSIGLLTPGNINEWKTAIENFIKAKQTPKTFSANAVPTFEGMLTKYLDIYNSLIQKKFR